MNFTPAYTSAEYTLHQQQVALVNAVYDGIDSASSYLTQFPREENKAFYDRQSKATLKNFVKRIAISTRNIALNKPPIVEVNAKIVPMLSSIDKVSSIDLFIRDVTLEVVKDGFTFIAVDAPQIDESIKTKSDEQKNDVRPYMYIIPRSSVVNWKMKADGTFERITIKEVYTSQEGRYDDEYKEQYRIYFSDGIVEVWRDAKLFETIILGVAFVPIVKVGSSSIPALYDIAKLNINYMNRKSNLDRYLTIAALPVPVIYGSTEDSKLVIGVDEALSFNDKNESGFEWVELSGTSIKALQDDLDMTEEAILSEAVALTSDDTSIAKNTDQVASENLEGFGRLSQLTTEVETGINIALTYFGRFMSVEEVGQITLPKEFKDNHLTSDQVKDIIALYTSGLISIDTAISKLVEGQIVEVENLDVEKAKLNDITGS